MRARAASCSDWLEAEGCLADLDGTLVAGGAALFGARDLVRHFGERLVVVSNDAEHTPVQLARRLGALGLPIAPDRILLAGTVALDTIAVERPGARIFLLGGFALHRHARRLGLEPIGVEKAEEAEIVLVGRDRGFSFARLAAAANAVRAGAILMAANPDRTHPGRAGRVVPETGALLAAIMACTREVPVRVFGKPEPLLFQRGIARLGVAPSALVVIGDNPETDGAGAERLSLHFVHASALADVRLSEHALLFRAS